MKFKRGDTVISINGAYKGQIGKIIWIAPSSAFPYQVRFGNLYTNKSEEYLRGITLAGGKETNPKDAAGIQTFDSGATRTSEDGRLSYVRGLSSVVLRRYLQYLAKHRKQADGSMREFDNWKQGIPMRRSFDGLGRHFFTLWLLMEGLDIYDDSGQEDIQDVLCAIMFNTMSMLHQEMMQPRIIQPTEEEKSAASG